MKAPGLRTKFLAVSLGMVALLGLASVIFIRTSLTNKLELELQKRGVSIAVHLAEDIVTSLLTENFLELQMIALNHKKSDEDIEYIFIESSDGRVLAHTFGSLFPTDLITERKIDAGGVQALSIRPLITEKGRIFDISAPVLKGALATVHVGISGRPVRRSVAGIIGSILWITAVVLLCGSVLAVIFTLKITNPLARFSEAVKTVGSGGQGQRVPVTTGDEIGRLAEAFNQMMDDLETTTVSRAHLERLVRERTAALSDAISRLKKEITERERAEAITKEINAKLLALIEAMPDAVFFKDTGGRYLTVNRKFEEHAGISREMAIGMTDEHFMPPDIAERCRTSDEAIMRTGRRVHLEDTWTAPDGGKKYFESVKAPIYDSRGTLLGVLGVSRDVTERKKMEEALHRTNLTLSALIRYSPLAVIGTGALDGEIQIWNTAAERLFGWKEEEVIGRENPIVPRDKKDEYRQLRDSVQQGSPYVSKELLRQKKNGDPIYLNASSAAIYDANGAPVMLVGIFEDITGRKQAESEILRLSRRNELILNSAGEGIFGLDREGKITFINPAAAEMVGWTVRELVGRPSHETFHHSRSDGSAYPREECPYHKALMSGHVHHIKDELFWRRDRTGFPVEYVSTPIAEDGKITGAVIVFKDISERKQAEEALKSAVVKANEEKAKTESIIAAIGDAINIQDTEHRILYQNQTSVNRFGRHIGEYCYKTFRNRAAVCERCHLAMAFSDGKVHTLEQKMTTDQGTFYNEITGSPLRNAEGRIVAGIELIRDVTERKKLLEQLEAVTGNLAVRVQEEVEKNRAQEQLMQIQSRHAAMGEMIDNIAHQWRQPLNNLGLIVQGMKKKFIDGSLTPEKMEEQAKTGMSLVTYMSQTISDFTHFLRHDKALARFRIKDVVATALTVAETSLKRNAVTVIADIDDDITVTGYRNEYTQVVVNILNNARDIFLERGIPKPVITLRAYCEDHASVLAIADNGGGITREVMDKIFSPNFTTKGPNGGTGIGLYMAKIIIEKNMQGRLSVCNTGEGAEFRVEVRHGG